MTHHLDWVLERVSHNAPHGYTWEEWGEVADFVGEIDFGCRFNEEGECKSFNSLGFKGCCHSCATWGGYLEHTPVEALEEIRALYDDQDGFWRPTGCALPRKWRSSICHQHRCGDDDNPAWMAFEGLFFHKREKAVWEVREIMQEAGLLRDSQLVQIS